MGNQAPNNPNASNSSLPVAGTLGAQGQNPTNPAANAYDQYNYLPSQDSAGSVSVGRAGVSDGSWVPFQNYSQAGGSSLEAMNPVGAANAAGFGSNTGGSSPPWGTNPPPGVSGLLPSQKPQGLGGLAPTFNSPPPAPNIGAPGIGQGGVGSPGLGGGGAAGGPTIGGGGAGQPAGPGLVTGPGPNGFYGTILSRYLSGR